MKDLSPSEQLTQLVISNHLADVTVKQADFNTGSPRHDLELLRAGEPFAAVEVTEDRDEAESQWEALGEPLMPVPGSVQGWRVELQRAPRHPTKWVNRVLAGFLQELERTGMDHTV